MTRHKSRKFTAFLWHRRIGLLAFILVIILAITGIMLNHSHTLKLDRTYIDNSFILNWYGIQPEGEPTSYRVNPLPHSPVISVWQYHLFYNHTLLSTLEQKLRGVVQSDSLIVIALDHAIMLLSDKGELVERIDTSSSFNQVQRLGMKHNHPVIKTTDQQYYLADDEILNWHKTTPEGITWSTSTALSPQQREQLLTAYRGHGLKLERILLDLHSGRIFGHYGSYLMDGVALALLWLASSGLWVWHSRRRKIRHKKHYIKHHR